MHSIVFVLLPPTTTDVVGETTKLLARYNSGLELPPHKRRFDQSQIIWWKEKFGITELSELANKLQREFESEYGTDDQGLYEISTFNEWGRWDAWHPMKFFEPKATAMDKWDEKLTLSLCPVAKLKKEHFDSPHSLVTPDGQWHDVDDFGYKTILQFEKGVRGLHPQNVEPVAKWNQHVQNTISKYPDHLVFVLDCHN